MLHARYTPYILKFKTPGGTSRGILHEKRSWFIAVEDDRAPGTIGLGECNILAGLSADDRPGYEAALKKACARIHEDQEVLLHDLREWPSIRFGVEMALRDLHRGGHRKLFDTPFSRGEQAIRINGLVWMGTPEFMAKQIEEKIANGFNCIKLKIGAIDFEQEIRLIQGIRSRFSAREMEIRVDANGAFSPENALEKLTRLAAYDLHSIEQPIAAGQWETMASLCRQTPLPIALDEELIGVNDHKEQMRLLATIAPQYIILKPSLLGGFQASVDWIEIAENNGTQWWVTSALESNVGLNAIAQWTATLNSPLPQGLGTGQLFTNNFECPLVIEHGTLAHRGSQWILDPLWNQAWNTSY